jgi:farnesyl-diphosphate farnesyltransferase
LRANARDFGEGLQLVNILKDASADSLEGRRYLPPGVDQAEVFALARADLRSAAAYVLELQGANAPSGLVAFTALPVRLARATLDRVEAMGPGAKLSRPEVRQALSDLRQALKKGAPAVCGD